MLKVPKLSFPSCFNVICLARRFPPDFLHRAGNILKRLFRVFAHIYYAHYEKMVELHMDAQLNTAFKHFIFFVKVFCGRSFAGDILLTFFKEFKLVDSKDLAPMADLIEKFERQEARASWLVIKIIHKFIYD